MVGSNALFVFNENLGPLPFVPAAFSVCETKIV